MQCKKHPRFKGLSKPKRDCQQCRDLHSAVWKASGKFYSITTPGWYCDIIHVLAECMTVMIYGSQPRFFWRKGVKSSNKAKKFFSGTYSGLKKLEKQDPARIRSLKSIFAIFVFQEKMKMESERILGADKFIKSVEVADDLSNKKPDPDIVNNFLDKSADKPKPTKWQMLKEMEKQNGTKEEGSGDNN